MKINEAYEAYRSNPSEETLAVLYPFVKERATRVVGKLMHEEPDEDIVSEIVMLVLYQHLDKFDPKRSAAQFSTWVEQIARNHCRSKWREYYRNVEEPLEELSPTVRNTLFSSESPETTTQIRELFEQLTGAERQLLSAKMEGLTSKEIGGLLGITVNAVDLRWQDLRKKVGQIVGLSRV